MTTSSTPAPGSAERPASLPTVTAAPSPPSTFDVVHWNDLTEQAAVLVETSLLSPPGPLGLHTFVDNFTDKLRNLTRGLSTGRLRAIQGVARTTDRLRYP